MTAVPAAVSSLNWSLSAEKVAGAFGLSFCFLQTIKQHLPVIGSDLAGGDESFGERGLKVWPVGRFRLDCIPETCKLSTISASEGTKALSGSHSRRYRSNL